MPIAHPQAQCAPARNPVVVMTKSEAQALTLAITNARIALVSKVRRIERMRTLSDVQKVQEASPLRADLAALANFQEAHDEAHGLGGY